MLLFPWRPNEKKRSTEPPQAARLLSGLRPPVFKIEVVVARLRLVPARSVIQHPRKQFAPLRALAGREPREPLARPVHLNPGTVRNARTG